MTIDLPDLHVSSPALAVGISVLSVGAHGLLRLVQQSKVIQKGESMLPLVVSFIVRIVPVATGVIKRYGGIKGFLAVEHVVIGAIRKCIADWHEAKSATSDGGVKITAVEAKMIAVDVCITIEDVVGPLINVPAGVDLGTFGEELLTRVAPEVFHLLTGQDLATYETQMAAAQPAAWLAAPGGAVAAAQP